MNDHYDTFTFACPHCGETTQVVEGLEIGHGCPPAPAVEVSGCADDEETT